MTIEYVAPLCVRGTASMRLSTLLAAGLTFALTIAAHAADCARPKELRFEVTGKIVRSEVGFTQGLEWRDGKLYESTGAVGGHSGLSTIA
ncbi:MAG: hypothetical protein E6G97_11290, partial [Alphaproteobacteria bacterium]